MGEFQNYNGNPALTAAQKLVHAASDARRIKTEDLYAALRTLYPTNPEDVDYLLFQLNDETYDYYERHSSH